MSSVAPANPAVDAPEVDAPGSSRLTWVVNGVIALLVVAVAVTGGVLLMRAHDLRSVPAADNLAVVDRTATTQVQKAVSSDLTTILSFDHSNPDATKDAAAKVLTGSAKRDYGQLFSVLLTQAGSQQLTLKTKVDTVGVTRLSASSAELLVFLDQSSTRGTDGTSNVAAAQIAVSAVKRDGHWLISGLDPL